MTLPCEYKMQHEMCVIEELVFVTKLLFVPGHKERGKSKQFNSRGSAQRCSPAYRSCQNACRIVMALRALNLLSKKLLVMPTQLLL
jgi:hypothetical protein